MHKHTVSQEEQTYWPWEPVTQGPVVNETECQSTGKALLARILEDHTAEQITAAIVALPAKRRVVLALCYFEQLTEQEIGMVLHLTESQVSEILTFAKLQPQSFWHRLRQVADWGPAARSSLKRGMLASTEFFHS